jgi:hypothetical protein
MSVGIVTVTRGDTLVALTSSGAGREAERTIFASKGSAPSGPWAHPKVALYLVFMSQVTRAHLLLGALRPMTEEHPLLEALAGVVSFWCLLAVIFIAYRWVRHVRERE